MSAIPRRLLRDEVSVEAYDGEGAYGPVYEDPVDVAAKVEIYNLMNELKRQGIGVLFVSSEMPEILGISDRIVVMCDGRVTGEMPIGEATQEKIMDLATRFEAKINQVTA